MKSRGWTAPECTLIKETGDPHNKMFYMKYSVGQSEFPVGAGRSKDLAKRRAAARALAELQGIHLRGTIQLQLLISKLMYMKFSDNRLYIKTYIIKLT